MVLTKPQKPAKPEKQKQKESAPADTEERLNQIKEQLPEKPKVFAMIQDLLKNYKKLDPKERQKQIAAILSAAAFSYLFGKEKKEDEEGGQGEQGDQQVAAGTETTEGETEETEEAGEESEEELSPREKRRKVGCNDRRLCLIQTNPAGKSQPKICKDNPTYPLKYGLPAHYPTFVEEMWDLFAPEASTESAAIKKITHVLKHSPMGKYQCMPMYLFPGVGLAFEGEEGLKNIWKFLKDEKLQRKACKAYIAKSGTKNPLYAAAGYYGGPNGIKKVKEIEKKSREEQEQEKKKKIDRIYPTVWSYANSVAARHGSGPLDLDRMADAIAIQESSSYEGKTKPRDEAWEEDQRYAYNRQKDKRKQKAQIA